MKLVSRSAKDNPLSPQLINSASVTLSSKLLSISPTFNPPGGPEHSLFGWPTTGFSHRSKGHCWGTLLPAGPGYETRGKPGEDRVRCVVWAECVLTEPRSVSTHCWPDGLRSSGLFQWSLISFHFKEEEGFKRVSVPVGAVFLLLQEDVSEISFFSREESWDLLFWEFDS